MVKRDVKDRKVYYGVVNPVGEDDGKKTTYFTKGELDAIGESMTGVGFHIDHNLKGGGAAESGHILEAKVHPKTNQLWASYILYNNHNGNMADNLMNNLGEGNASELSLGYKFKVDGNGDVLGHQITDLSLCFKGARDGTIIKGSVPASLYRDGIKDNDLEYHNQNKTNDSFFDFIEEDTPKTSNIEFDFIEDTDSKDIEFDFV